MAAADDGGGASVREDEHSAAAAAASKAAADAPAGDPDAAFMRLIIPLRAAPVLVPPINFSAVSPGIYRSGFVLLSSGPSLLGS